MDKIQISKKLDEMEEITIVISAIIHTTMCACQNNSLVNEEIMLKLAENKNNDLLNKLQDLSIKLLT